MKKNSRAIIVLGMHHSGTSLLSRGLQTLDISFRGPLLDANQWNPRGNLENADIVRLNDILLGIAGKRWDSLTHPPWEEMEPRLKPFKVKALDLLQRDFAGAELCGIKDPRATRLLPFWKSVFGEAGMQDRYVIALRNPISVARSLSARNGFRPEKSYLLWLLHMFAAIEDTQDKPRLVVDYDELIADPTWQLTRVAATLAIGVTMEIRAATAEYAESFLSNSLRHSPHDSTAVRDDPRISELVGKAYDLLRQLALDEVQTTQAKVAFEHQWHALQQALQDIAPVFQYLDDCEDQIDALTQAPEASIAAPVDSRPEVPVQAAGILGGESGLQTVKSDLRVSVVIPLFNHEQYIEAAIESVLAQTIRPAEIIVIDDGSTDSSAAKMRKLCAAHPEITFWSWPNQGAHHTLNAAIHRATGDFVAILNSDDCYDPGRLAACLAIVQTEPEVDAVATGVSFMDAQGRSIGNPWYEDARTFYQEEGDLSLGLFHANFLLSTSNLFIRRTLFESVGYFSPMRYTHDLEFFLRLVLAKAHLHFLDQPLLHYRWHAENTISESRARVDVELAAIFAFFLYREQLANGADTIWRSWLERYVEVLGKKDLLELVEGFLELLQGGVVQGKKSVTVTAPLAAEFKGLMNKLGVNWAEQEIRDPLLADFVTARNSVLRRSGRPGPASKLILELTESNTWLTSQREAAEKTVAEREQSIAMLQAQVQELLTGNAWLTSQRDVWEEVAAKREQSITMLQAHVNSQQTSNDWLGSQRDAWERIAGEREELIASLRAQVQELLSGNAWLDSQRLAWERVAVEREQSIAVLISNLQEITERLADSDTALEKIRSHRWLKLANYLSRARLL